MRHSIGSYGHQACYKANFKFGTDSVRAVFQFLVLTMSA